MKPINPPARILLGAGPTNLHPLVNAALAAPMVGHLDPYLKQVMDETVDLMRFGFATRNEVAIAVAGAGSGAMTAALVNLLEPGDRALCLISGVFSDRMAQIAQRAGAQVTRLEVDWGRPVLPEQVEKALQAGGFKVLMLVQGETSTGVLQDVETIARLAGEKGVLSVVDAVPTLTAIPCPVDEWGIDVCYTGGQKGLSAPPGISPVTFSPRAMEAVRTRQTLVSSWYFDVALAWGYWGPAHTYHYTGAVNLVYGLHEALRLIQEEGLEARFRRHALHSTALQAGLEGMGLKLAVPAPCRLPTVTAVWVPDGVDDAQVRGILREDYSIEIGGGLGKFAGRIWRIGQMGYGCSQRNVLLVLSALRDALLRSGFKAGDGIASASAVYQRG